LASLTKSFSYASYLLYAFKADYSEPNVEEPEPTDIEGSEPNPEVKVRARN